MAKRINVILPEKTIQTTDRLVNPDERSRGGTQTAEGMREQLKQTTIRDRDLDREIMAEWTVVDHESSQELDKA